VLCPDEGTAPGGETRHRVLLIAVPVEDRRVSLPDGAERQPDETRETVRALRDHVDADAGAAEAIRENALVEEEGGDTEAGPLAERAEKREGLRLRAAPDVPGEDVENLRPLRSHGRTWKDTLTISSGARFE
jgi:hypothetical protein